MWDVGLSLHFVFWGTWGLTLQLFFFFFFFFLGGGGGVVCLSTYLLGGACGFESISLFFGGGRIFLFFILFCLGGGGGFTLISWGITFLRGIFFSGVLCWKFIYICGESLIKFDQHSHIHSHNFFSVLWGGVLFCLGAQTCSLIIVFG